MANKKKQTSSTEALSIVYLPVKPRNKLVTHEERMRQIPRRLDPVTRQWTITRRDYFVHNECRSSPPARDLPTPPAGWFTAGFEAVDNKPEKSSGGQDNPSCTDNTTDDCSASRHRRAHDDAGSDNAQYDSEDDEVASTSSSELEIASLGQSPCFGK